MAEQVGQVGLARQVRWVGPVEQTGQVGLRRDLFIPLSSPARPAQPEHFPFVRSVRLQADRRGPAQAGHYVQVEDAFVQPVQPAPC